MKTLRSILVLALGVSAFGQAPPVLRNPYTTNDFVAADARVKSVMRTNPAFVGQVNIGTAGLYVTNFDIVTGAANTNSILVSGAGTTTANGTYTYALKDSVNNILIWTNTTGSGVIYDDNLTIYSDAWTITNAAHGAGDELYLYTQVTLGGSGWVVGAGVAPAPSVIYSTNFTTNVVYYLAVANMPILRSTNLTVYVDPVAGNNSTAIKGRPDYPWSNLYSANSNAVSGDVVTLSAGIHNPTNAGFFTARAGVKYTGLGTGITTVKRGFTLIDNSVLTDVSFDTTTNADAPIQLLGGTATNLYVARVIASGYQDGGYTTSSGTVSGTFDDCYFTSPWDAWFDARPTVSLGVLEFNRCTFYVPFTNKFDSTFNNAHCIRISSGGTYRFNNCMMYMDGGISTNAVCVQVENNAAVVELNGCTLVNKSSGGGNSYSIINSNSAVVRVSGGYYKKGSTIGTITTYTNGVPTN